MIEKKIQKILPLSPKEAFLASASDVTVSYHQKVIQLNIKTKKKLQHLYHMHKQLLKLVEDLHMQIYCSITLNYDMMLQLLS